MTTSSLVLSSLLTLVALMDTNPMASSCINSTIVKKVTVEGGKVPEERGFEWFKEKWMGSCGPLKSDNMGNLELVQQWFSTRGLKTAAIEILFHKDKNFVITPEVVSIPFESSDDINVISRLLTKSILLQNKFPVEGVSGEIATDLILSDIFGSNFVSQTWKTDGTGLFGEFSSLRRDCERELVPKEQRIVLCSKNTLIANNGKISNWALRWIANHVFNDVRSDHEIGKSVEISKKLFDVVKGIAEDKTMNTPIVGIDDLEVRAKNLFSKLDSSMECFRKWSQNYEKVQVVIAESADKVHLAEPLPKNTIVLGFDSGFHLVNGDFLELPEGDVFLRTRRVAFVGCESPTIADILQYSGADMRLLYIQACDDKEIKLDLFEKYGAAGVQHQNPNVRFLQFHKPSIKLAMDWGLKSTNSFEFSRVGDSTPTKLRRLFGWNNSDAMRLVSAPIPVVEIFNSQKGEIPSLKGLIQSDQNEVRDTSQLDLEESEDPAEQTKNIF